MAEQNNKHYEPFEGPGWRAADEAEAQSKSRRMRGRDPRHDDPRTPKNRHGLMREVRRPLGSQEKTYKQMYIDDEEEIVDKELRHVQEKNEMLRGELNKCHEMVIGFASAVEGMGTVTEQLIYVVNQRLLGNGNGNNHHEIEQERKPGRKQVQRSVETAAKPNGEKNSDNDPRE